MTTLEASIIGIAIWGPGLEGWTASRPILAGETPYEPRPSPAPPPFILPATERRRAGPVIRLALAVAQEAAQQAATASGLEPGSLRSVFGSSNGDGVVVGSILEALARGAPGERVVSPTQFHNSVHNAAAGYWCIAHASRQPATCLGAHDATWAASLLKAVVDVAAEGEPVLLACYDHPLPPPLDALRPTASAFAAGLVLAPPGHGPLLRLTPGANAQPPSLPAGLQALMNGNAAARALPLLCALAANKAGRHALDYLGAPLAVEFEP